MTQISRSHDSATAPTSWCSPTHSFDFVATPCVEANSGLKAVGATPPRTRRIARNAPMDRPVPVHTARLPLVQLSAERLADEMFRNARPDDLIPICSFRPGRLTSQKGGPYIHSYFPLRCEDHYEAANIIETTIALREVAYWMAVTLKPQACDQQAVWNGHALRFEYGKKYVAQIHGLFFDLDVGRSPEDSKNDFDQMTAEEALSGLHDLIGSEVIPMPTLTATSGRGRYFLYLFNEPIDATPENVARWRVVVDGVLPCIKHLAPDIGACHTLNRCFKVPGALDGRVVYSMFNDGSGELRRYNLDEIDAFLLNHDHHSDGEREPKAKRETYVPLGAVTIQKRKTNGKRPWLQNARSMIVRRNELLRLNEHRAGRWPGMRHNLLLYFTTAERRIVYERFGNDRAAVKAIALRRALRFNSKLADPLPKEEIAGIFDTMPEKPHRNETIVTMLGVTKEEMLACRLTSLIPSDERARKQNAEIEKKNANDLSAWWLDYFVTNGMPVLCISNLTGKDRSTVSRYVKKIQLKGIALPLRASLRGLGRWK